MSYSKERDAAAEKFLSDNLPGIYKALDKGGDNIYSEDQLEHMGEDSFRAGHDHCLKSEVVKGLVTQLKNETDYIRSQGAKPLMKSVEALEAYAKAVKEIE